MIYAKKYYWMSCFLIISIFLESFQSFAQCTQDYSWATWSNFNGTNATGSILVSGKTVSVTMTANYTFGFTNSIILLADYFSSFKDYAAINNSTVPKTTWSAGQGGKTTMCFSEPVTNPILLFASLGSPKLPVTLSFSEPYTPLYDGGSMKYIDGYSLMGSEGNAIVLFPGTFTCLTINSTTPEDYTNITWGLRPPIFPINITGNSNGCGSVTLTATGGQTYKWSGGKTPDNAINTFEASGVYTVEATDKNGCKAISLKSVTINVVPTTNLKSSITKTICQGQVYLGYKSSGIYIDTLKSTGGCDSIRTLKLTVLDMPQITFGGNKKICDGKPIELTPTIVPSTVSTKYKWSSGESTPAIVVKEAGRYELTVADSVCSTKEFVDILAGESPKVLADATVCMDKPVLAGGIDPNLSYFWEHSGETTPEVMIKNEGVYKVRITNQFGCSQSRILTVAGLCNVRITAPAAFSPNNDTVNDVFKAFIEGGTIVRMDIFNRWGNLIYSQEGAAPQWDGMFENKSCSIDTYAYVLRYKVLSDTAIHEYLGSILLLK